MGNKAAKPAAPAGQYDDVLFLKSVPPIDQDFARWLARDVERIHRFVPRKPRAIKPPDHYIEYMRMNGWLDVDLDDPDLAHLFK
nr:aspartyl/glutamyl-tRNA (Asn/Gln) amidotransferase subunit B [Ipomoea batatas]